MDFLNPGVATLIGALVLLYGVLVGGTWARRHDQKKWDTICTVVFIIIAALSTIDLVVLGARQTWSFRIAKAHTECVSEHVIAIRNGAPAPECSMIWDRK